MGPPYRRACAPVTCSPPGRDGRRRAGGRRRLHAHRRRGLAQDCATDPAAAGCGPTSWPIAGHSANSDPWLVGHRTVITEMRPRVLVLNFLNGTTAADSMQATRCGRRRRWPRARGITATPTRPRRCSCATRSRRSSNLTDRRRRRGGRTRPARCYRPRRRASSTCWRCSRRSSASCYGFTDPNGPVARAVAVRAVRARHDQRGLDPGRRGGRAPRAAQPGAQAGATTRPRPRCRAASRPTPGR